jgi:hypothetical protein
MLALRSNQSKTLHLEANHAYTWGGYHRPMSDQPREYLGILPVLFALAVVLVVLVIGGAVLGLAF